MSPDLQQCQLCMDVTVAVQSQTWCALKHCEHAATGSCCCGEVNAAVGLQMCGNTT